MTTDNTVKTTDEIIQETVKVPKVLSHMSQDTIRVLSIHGSEPGLQTETEASVGLLIVPR